MSANATTKLTSAATNSKAGVDLNIVADSVYDATGKRTELDFGLSVTTKASSVGVSVSEDGTVLITVQGKDKDGITAEEIQAMLADAKATSTSVSEDMMDAVRNATITGTGISAPTSAAQGNQWTDVNTMNSTVTANKGESLVLQIGDTSDSFNQLRVGIKDCHVDALGLTDMKIGDQDSAAKALDMIKSAINYVSDVRGTLGATQNRLDHTINNLSVMQENIQDAESTIRDTDVADEMMAYTKNNILIQSAQAMLAQANQVPQGVLQLLQ